MTPFINLSHLHMVNLAQNAMMAKMPPLAVLIIEGYYTQILWVRNRWEGPDAVYNTSRHRDASGSCAKLYFRRHCN